MNNKTDKLLQTNFLFSPVVLSRTRETEAVGSICTSFSKCSFEYADRRGEQRQTPNTVQILFKFLKLVVANLTDQQTRAKFRLQIYAVRVMALSRRKLPPTGRGWSTLSHNFAMRMLRRQKIDTKV